jgi:hypothetical protein
MVYPTLHHGPINYFWGFITCDPHWIPNPLVSLISDYQTFFSHPSGLESLNIQKAPSPKPCRLHLENLIRKSSIHTPEVYEEESQWEDRVDGQGNTAAHCPVSYPRLLAITGSCNQSSVDLV